MSFNLPNFESKNISSRFLAAALAALVCVACNSNPDDRPRTLKESIQKATPAQPVNPALTQPNFPQSNPGEQVVVGLETFESLAKPTDASLINKLKNYSIKKSVESQHSNTSLTLKDLNVVHDKLGDPESTAYFYDENTKTFHFFEKNSDNSIDIFKSIKIPANDFSVNFVNQLKSNQNVAFKDRTIRQFYQLTNQ